MDCREYQSDTGKNNVYLHSGTERIRCLLDRPGYAAEVGAEVEAFGGLIEASARE